MSRNLTLPSVFSNIHYAKAYFIDDHGSYHLTSSILPDFPVLKTVLDTRRYIFLPYPAKYFSKDSAVFTIANSSLLANLSSSLYVDPRFDNNILHNALTSLVLNFIEIKMRHYELKNKLWRSSYRFTSNLSNPVLSLPSRAFHYKNRLAFKRWTGLAFFPLLPLFKKTHSDLFHTFVPHILRHYKLNFRNKALFRNHRRLYVDPFFPLPSFSLYRPGKSRVKDPFFFNVCSNDLFYDLYSETVKRFDIQPTISSLRYTLQCNFGVFNLNRVSPEMSIAYSSRKLMRPYRRKKRNRKTLVETNG